MRRVFAFPPVILLFPMYYILLRGHLYQTMTGNNSNRNPQQSKEPGAGDAVLSDISPKKAGILSSLIYQCIPKG